MTKINPEAKNMIQPFYASSVINRHGSYRKDKNLLNNIILEKNTKFIPYYKGKNLFTQINKNIMPVIFNKIQLDEFFPNGIEDTIFLGVANTVNYIGVDLSPSNQKFDCWLKENNIIINEIILLINFLYFHIFGSTLSLLISNLLLCLDIIFPGQIRIKIAYTP